MNCLILKTARRKCAPCSPNCLPAENWQSAFFSAFRENFGSPLDVEKWWALRVVAFAAHMPGPQWTLAVSRRKLDDILTVPVDIRYASNAMPSRAQISLQSAIQNFEPPHQTAILQTKLRDLDLVQLRLALPLAEVAEVIAPPSRIFSERGRKSHSFTVPLRYIVAKPKPKPW